MTTIAFLGLGRMGLPMAVNLASAGHELTVWNRSPEKAERFATEHGARAAASPAEAVAASEVVITMLADDRALLDAWTGEGGALETVRPGTLAIDMATVAPETIVALGRRLREREVSLVDAPVSGSVAAATASPTATSSSATGTLSKSPMSGTRTSSVALTAGPSGGR